ncbi:MAG: MBL fold metallo-hydrolase [Chloroflexi bacterium]|nr:MBL fold metallo-hydrolase [Chloroflexota bacterium]
MQIIPDLYQMQIPIPDNPLGHVNIYAIREGDGWTLVDTGFDADEAYSSLVDQFRELAGDLTRLKRVVMTHWHADHFGLAHRVKANTNAQIMMHEADVTFLNSIYHDRLNDAQGYGAWLAFNGAPPDEVDTLQQPMSGGFFANGGKFAPDVPLRGGEELRIGRFKFDVVWTPGHTVGHICLHEPTERILISGDHVLPIITPSVAYNLRAGGNPLANFLGSLHRLRGLDVAFVLPAHEHSFHDLTKRIDEITRHHLERCEEILASIDGPFRTAYQISSKITWANGEMVWDRMPRFHKLMAVGETLAHLYHMLYEGKVENTADDGLQKWRVK